MAEYTDVTQDAQTVVERRGVRRRVKAGRNLICSGVLAGSCVFYSSASILIMELWSRHGSVRSSIARAGRHVHDSTLRGWHARAHAASLKQLGQGGISELISPTRNRNRFQ